MRKRKSFDQLTIAAEAAAACEGVDTFLMEDGGTPSAPPSCQQSFDLANTELPAVVPSLEAEVKPVISKAGWTEDEDAIVHVAVRALGTQWQAVANRLPGPCRLPRARS